MQAVPAPRRVLGLWDLIIYGIVLIQPIAPVGIFGLATKSSRGHVLVTILIAMVAMMLTATSYGRLAARYPSAGSAYTYVSRGFGPHAGFLVGWAMFLDYLIIPAINTIYGALTLQRLFPSVPYLVWALLFAAVITILNLMGVRSMARTNSILLAAMFLVIGAYVWFAVRFLLVSQGWAGVLSVEPFYNPRTFDMGVVMTATSLAALTYIGFDGVTTLAEEVKNPRRTVPLATVLVCLLTGLFSSVEVYLAQRVWPDYTTFPNLETAFMDVTRRAGGELLFQGMGVILVVAAVGSGLAGQAGAARLLYGMGREDMLPRRFFGYLDPRLGIPAYNVFLLGVLAVVGAWLVSYQFAAELLNFGAFLAFMGVNLSAAREFLFRRSEGGKRNLLLDAAVPALGFLFCLGIWWSLPVPAKVGGGCWFAGGVAWLALKTRGFRERPRVIDFSEA
jgi:amino acid transporter